MFYIMKKQCSLFCVIVGVLLFSFAYGQNQNTISDSLATEVSDSIVVDPVGPDKYYREDQFYVGLTFNLMTNFPSGVSQSGFSGGIHTGFIRDIPLNKKRNTAIGIGLGWSYNSYRLNLLISRDQAGDSFFQVLDRKKYNYDTNRYTTALLEMPLQFRWRTSSASSYKFWRIYAGLQLGYLYYFRSKFEQPGKRIVQTKVDGLNRLRYGVNFTFGYNTFNFTVYYSLNPLFDAQTLDGHAVDISTFKIGLMFYVL